MSIFINQQYKEIIMSTELAITAIIISTISICANIAFTNIYTSKKYSNNYDIRLIIISIVFSITLFLIPFNGSDLLNNFLISFSLIYLCMTTASWITYIKPDPYAKWYRELIREVSDETYLKLVKRLDLISLRISTFFKRLSI